MEPNSSMEQRFLQKLIEVIDANLHNENFGVNELATELGMNRVTLHRKVKSVVKKSVSRFIRETRLERAYELLLQQAGTVSEIAFRVGFGSVSYFNRCFNEHYGFPPGEILKGMHEISREESSEKMSKKSRKLGLWIAAPAMALIFLFIYISIQNNRDPENNRRIVVLPFVNDSPDTEQKYMIDVLREEILRKLNLIENLSVVPRTTSDNYSNSGKNVKNIGKELNADYLIEGRGHLVDNEIKLNIDLIDTRREDYIWNSPKYKIENEVGSISLILEEIALSIASEMNVNISQGEKQKIERLPTKNRVAYNLYLQGLNYAKLDRIDVTDHTSQSRKVFEEAIKLDSTFAEAYYELAFIYIYWWATTYKVKYDGQLYHSYLDSGLVYLDKAFELNLGNADKARQLKSMYYLKKGQDELGLEEFEKIWNNKHKDYTYYETKALYNYKDSRFYEAAKNNFLYYESIPSSVSPDQNSIAFMIENLVRIGFPETANRYAEKMYLKDTHPARYLNFLAKLDNLFGNNQQAIEKKMQLFQEDTTNLNLCISNKTNYYALRDFERAYFWMRKQEQAQMDRKGSIDPDYISGNLYLLHGDGEMGEWHLNGWEKIILDLIKHNHPNSQSKMVYAELASIYSLRGEKQKALEYLKIMASRETFGIETINFLERYATFDNIRNEPGFKEILENVKAKYQKEHKKVKKLLVSKGMEPN